MEIFLLSLHAKMSARMYARFKITAEEILKLVHAIEMGEGKMTLLTSI